MSSNLNGNRIIRFTLVLILFSLISFESKSQSVAIKNQSKLIEYLGLEKYDEIMASNPSYLQFLDVRCSDGYLILDMPEEKTQGFENAEKIGKRVFKKEELIAITPDQFIEESSHSEFNILMYNFRYDRKEITYYVLGNTGKVLQIQPIERINELVNKTGQEKK